MTAFPDFVEISTRFAVATTPGEVWNAVKAAAEPLGFHHMCVLAHQADLRERITPAVIYFDAPLGFTDAHDRAGHGPNNPLVQRALTRLEPLAVNEIWAAPMTDRQKRVLAFISMSLNVRDGFTIPIRLDEQLDGIVMFGGLKPDTSPLTRSFLHLLAHSAFKRAKELTETPIKRRKGSLTGRELECLRWTALGKTDAEIGTILSISARTARFHIENAKRKLGVSTRIQAVAEALKLRAIAA
jgi:LuxR family quorum sensing-dependent transcriptional regulator